MTQQATDGLSQWAQLAVEECAADFLWVMPRGKCLWVCPGGNVQGEKFPDPHAGLQVSTYSSYDLGHPG